MNDSSGAVVDGSRAPLDNLNSAFMTLKAALQYLCTRARVLASLPPTLVGLTMRECRHVFEVAWCPSIMQKLEMFARDGNSTCPHLGNLVIRYPEQWLPVSPELVSIKTMCQEKAVVFEIRSECEYEAELEREPSHGLRAAVCCGEGSQRCERLVSQVEKRKG